MVAVTLEWPQSIFLELGHYAKHCACGGGGEGGYLGHMARGNPQDWGQPQQPFLRDQSWHRLLPEASSSKRWGTVQPPMAGQANKLSFHC